MVDTLICIFFQPVKLTATVLLSLLMITANQVIVLFPNVVHCSYLEPSVATCRDNLVISVRKLYVDLSIVYVQSIALIGND